MNTQDAKRVLETALICAQQPMPLRDMRTLFADEIGADTLRSLLDELGLASLDQLPLLDGSGEGAMRIGDALADQSSLIDTQAALALDETVPAASIDEPAANDDAVPSSPDSAAAAAPMEPQA